MILDHPQDCNSQINLRFTSSQTAFRSLEEFSVHFVGVEIPRKHVIYSGPVFHTVLRILPSECNWLYNVYGAFTFLGMPVSFVMDDDAICFFFSFSGKFFMPGARVGFS